MPDLKIFAHEVEATALSQIEKIKSHPAFVNEKIRIMPDVHAGAGCVIGFTSTFSDLIVPNIIGVDIGCGVRAVKIGKYADDKNMNSVCAELDHFIRENIPSGHNVNKYASTHNSEVAEIAGALAESTGQDKGYVWKSLGSLGGGNHFIELDKDQNDDLWLVVHSGSRNFGLKIAEYYQALATVPEGFTQKEAYLDDKLKQQYCYAMDIAQRYAALNRAIITYRIMTGLFRMDQFGKGVVESTHNYINFNDGIIRKGAISAHKGEQVIIPWNMRDGIIIGEGKGNEDWNCSAPHGAGRVMGRNQAKNNLSLDEFKDTMKDVWSSCVNENTLDEAPMAYKDHTKVEELLKDTVDIKYRLKPVYNFKAEETRRRRRK